MPEYQASEKVEYTITENEVSGYQTIIEGSATEGFVVTNSHSPKPTPPDTGDDTSVLPWMTLLLVSGLGLGGTIAYKKRKEEDK